MCYNTIFCYIMTGLYLSSAGGLCCIIMCHTLYMQLECPHVICHGGNDRKCVVVTATGAHKSHCCEVQCCLPTLIDQSQGIACWKCVVVTATGAVGKAVYRMLVTQAFRQDRLLAAAQQFVAAVFGPSFMQAAVQQLNLANIVDNEMKASTPILMCSAPGFDASGRVDDLAAELNKQITSIAIGSL